jgi:S1-C subfamily serine protease
VVAVFMLIVVGVAFGLSAVVGGTNESSAGTAAAPAWLGLQMESLTNGSVVVASVVPGSPAAQAGLQPGDVITEIQSRPVGAPIDVTEAVDALRPGDTVDIQVVRGADRYTTQVKLARRPGSSP